jgi:hypothetical protein
MIPNLSQAELLAAAIEIVRRESLRDNALMSEAGKQRVLDHTLSRTRSLVKANKVRTLESHLRSMSNDLANSVREHTQERILSLVLSETGIDLNDFIRDEAKEIAEIVSRGQIKTKAEYRKVRGFLDELEGRPDDQNLLPVVVRMLDEFEMTMRRA